VWRSCEFGVNFLVGVGLSRTPYYIAMVQVRQYKGVASSDSYQKSFTSKAVSLDVLAILRLLAWPSFNVQNLLGH